MSNFDKFDKAIKLVPHVASAASFARYIADSNNSRKDLFELIQNCKIDELKCRWNVWRLVLGIISFQGTLESRIDQLKNSRESFKQKRTEAFSGNVGVKKQANIPKNPLMKAMMKTPKVEETNDQFLKDQIRKDVERTYQEMKFFQDENIIKLLSNVLFIWCKRNPQVSYKQGMNQVLASIVYVYFIEVYVEWRNPEFFLELEQEVKNAYIFFNSLEYAEPDIYAIFERVMNVQQEMYRTQADSSLKGAINPNSKNNTPILQRIITITDHKLKALDLELFRAIKLQDVQTKTFLLRWIRCMHTREFSLQNSFLIWDSIFLDFHEWPGSKCQFEFIDSMCLAMFIYMRQLALTRQTAYEIQQIYQKYPQLKKGGYLEELISLAWSLAQALRNPGSASDWYGEQSSKHNKKLQFVGNKETSSAKAAHREQQQKLEQQKQSMKKAAEQAKQLEKRKKQSSVEKEEEGIKKQQVEEEKRVQDQQQHQAEKIKNFCVVLEPFEWKQLHNQLKTALSSSKNEQSRNHVSAALQLLERKIQDAERNS